MLLTSFLSTRRGSVRAVRRRARKQTVRGVFLFFFQYLAAIRLRRLRGAFERVLPCGIASRELGLELVEYSKAGEPPWIASLRSRKLAKRCSSAA